MEDAVGSPWLAERVSKQRPVAPTSRVRAPSRASRITRSDASSGAPSSSSSSSPISSKSGTTAPTRSAARKASMPAPLPRSSTVSQARSAAMAVGLPQPRDRPAPVGITAMSASLYPRSREVGPQQQQLGAARAAARDLGVAVTDSGAGGVGTEVGVGLAHRGPRGRFHPTSRSPRPTNARKIRSSSWHAPPSPATWRAQQAPRPSRGPGRGASRAGLARPRSAPPRRRCAAAGTDRPSPSRRGCC